MTALAERTTVTEEARPARRVRPGSLLIGVLVLVLAFAVLFPLIRLLGVAFFPGGHPTLSALTGILTADWFLPALKNTAVMVGVATVLAVLIGAFLAWVNNRTNATMGWFGQLLPLTPIVIPQMAIATGWVVLSEPQVGLLSTRLHKIPLLKLIPSIYSLSGLVFVMTLTLVPYVFLVLQTAFRNLDPALEEASLASGAGRLRTLFRVSIPALRNAVGGAALLAVVMGLAEYAVPLIVGTPGKLDTISVHTVQFVTAAYPPQLGQGAVMGLLMLVVTGTVWVMYFRVAGGGHFAQIGGRSAQASVMKLGWAKWPARLFMIFFFLCASVLPLIALVIVALQPYWSADVIPSQFSLANLHSVIDSPQLAPSITNSVKFAAVGALVAIVVVMFLTSATKVRANRSAQVGLAVIKIPAAVAHLVLGVGFLIAFFGRPFQLGGTAVLLVGAYIVVTLPQASILGEAATSQVQQDLVEASEVSGASWWRTHTRVLMPLTAAGFLAAYALVFAMMAGEASVSRILARPGTTVAGFSILQLYEGGSFGQVAVLALMLSIINFVVVGGLVLLGRATRRNW
jgi:iron(III) transport system permease protein